MKYRFGLILLLFLAPAVITAQQPSASPTPPVVADDDVIADSIQTELIVIRASVASSKKGCLENLTAKNFEIYDEKGVLAIEYLSFDERTNQYVIGFYPEENASEYNWRKVKVKVKFSAEEKQEYGKISIDRQNGCDPDKN
ncbi:MAG TPA: hypothetical protein VGC97_02325 [Pyrinomonadaceae bacterium]|jgi:hypothetical protein